MPTLTPFWKIDDPLSKIEFKYPLVQGSAPDVKVLKAVSPLLLQSSKDLTAVTGIVSDVITVEFDENFAKWIADFEEKILSFVIEKKASVFERLVSDDSIIKGFKPTSSEKLDVSPGVTIFDSDRHPCHYVRPGSRITLALEMGGIEFTKTTFRLQWTVVAIKISKEDYIFVDEDQAMTFEPVGDTTSSFL